MVKGNQDMSTKCSSGEESCSDSSSICSKSTSSSKGCTPTSGAFHPIIVQHSYQDHANDNLIKLTAADLRKNRGGVAAPFPQKLYEMLEVIGEEQDIVSWQPHGRCFKIHKPAEFKSIILPKYFPNLSKMASFQRQLNLYMFKRLAKQGSLDKGGYYHELFLRGRPDLIHCLQRTKVKGTGIRARSNPDQEPDFWSMPWVNGDAPKKSAYETNRNYVRLPTPTNATTAQERTKSNNKKIIDTRHKAKSMTPAVGPLHAPSALGAPSANNNTSTPPALPIHPLMEPHLPHSRDSKIQRSVPVSRENTPILAPLTNPTFPSNTFPHLTVSIPPESTIPFQTRTYSSTTANDTNTRHGPARNTDYTNVSYNSDTNLSIAPPLSASIQQHNQQQQQMQLQYYPVTPTESNSVACIDEQQQQQQQQQQQHHQGHYYQTQIVQEQPPQLTQDEVSSATCPDHSYQILDEFGMQLFQQQQPYDDNMYEMDIETLVDEFFNTRDDTDFAAMLEKAVA